MGIFEWVKSQTGVWGPALLEMYYHNAAWINIMVVLYDLVLLLSWQNLDRVSDTLVQQIIEQAQGKLSNRKAGAFKLGSFHLSWEQAFAASRFPLVARRTAFWPRKATLENIRMLLTEDELARRGASRFSAAGLHVERKKRA
jgi:hypothetical protein